MEEKHHINHSTHHLSELEKNVLDEYILDLKNLLAVIPLHEENSRARYDREQGEGASFRLLNGNMDYVVSNGEFNEEEIHQIRDILEHRKGL